MSIQSTDLAISDHAFSRAKERIGLSRKAFTHLVAKAQKNGATQKDIKGNLLKWVVSQVMRYKLKNHTILYGSYMFICSKDMVITVLNIPNNLLPYTKYIKKDNK